MARPRVPPVNVVENMSKFLEKRDKAAAAGETSIQRANREGAKAAAATVKATTEGTSAAHLAAAKAHEKAVSSYKKAHAEYPAYTTAKESYHNSKAASHKTEANKSRLAPSTTAEVGRVSGHADAATAKAQSSGKRSDHEAAAQAHRTAAQAAKVAGNESEASRHAGMAQNHKTQSDRIGQEISAATSRGQAGKAAVSPLDAARSASAKAHGLTRSASTPAEHSAAAQAHRDAIQAHQKVVEGRGGNRTVRVASTEAIDQHRRDLADHTARATGAPVASAPREPSTGAPVSKSGYKALAAKATLATAHANADRSFTAHQAASTAHDHAAQIAKLDGNAAAVQRHTNMSRGHQVALSEYDRATVDEKGNAHAYKAAPATYAVGARVRFGGVNTPKSEQVEGRVTHVDPATGEHTVKWNDGSVTKNPARQLHAVQGSGATEAPATKSKSSRPSGQVDYTEADGTRVKSTMTPGGSKLSPAWDKSRAAATASARAKRTNSIEDHTAAHAAHTEAAQAHAANGNTLEADRHRSSAALHARATRTATRDAGATERATMAKTTDHLASDPKVAATEASHKATLATTFTKQPVSGGGKASAPHEVLSKQAAIKSAAANAKPSLAGHSAAARAHDAAAAAHEAAKKGVAVDAHAASPYTAHQNAIAHHTQMAAHHRTQAKGVSVHLQSLRVHAAHVKKIGPGQRHGADGKFQAGA